MKMMRMYQLDVDVTQDDEVSISQQRRDGEGASTVVIPYEQIEVICGVLAKAGEQIESEREATTEAASSFPEDQPKAGNNCRRR